MRLNEIGKSISQVNWFNRISLIQISVAALPALATEVKALYSVDYDHGEKQVAQMLIDRPEMQKFAPKGSMLRYWASAQYSGDAIGEPICWQADCKLLFKNCLGLHGVPTKDRPGVISLRKTFEDGRLIPSEVLWASFVFECFNIRSDSDFEKAFYDAVDGKLNRQQFILADAAIEDK